MLHAGTVNLEQLFWPNPIAIFVPANGSGLELEKIHRTMLNQIVRYQGLVQHPAGSCN